MIYVNGSYLDNNTGTGGSSKILKERYVENGDNLCRSTGDKESVKRFETLTKFSVTWPERYQSMLFWVGRSSKRIGRQSDVADRSKIATAHKRLGVSDSIPALDQYPHITWRPMSIDGLLSVVISERMNFARNKIFPLRFSWYLHVFRLAFVTVLVFSSSTPLCLNPLSFYYASPSSSLKLNFPFIFLRTLRRMRRKRHYY